MRVLLISFLDFFDTTNGATTSLRSLAGALTSAGHTISVLTTPVALRNVHATASDLVASLGQRAHVAAGNRAEVLQFADVGPTGSGAAIRIVCQSEHSALEAVQDWAELLDQAFLLELECLFDEEAPEAVITWGYRPIVTSVHEAAKRRNIPVAYQHLVVDTPPPKGAMETADAVIAASKFVLGRINAAYPEARGHVLYPVVSPRRCLAKTHTPTFATFINPAPHKGVAVFIRIAEQLYNEAPEIPLLVVEGSRSVANLKQMGVDLSQFPNITTMPNQADVRTVWSQTKVLLAPSVWNESFGMVVAEAHCNGIPALAHRIGGLPEALGQGGYSFDLPAVSRRNHLDLPTNEDVRPWTETIRALFEDAELYSAQQRRARGATAHVSEEAVAQQAEAILKMLID